LAVTLAGCGGGADDGGRYAVGPTHACLKQQDGYIASDENGSTEIDHPGFDVVPAETDPFLMVSWYGGAGDDDLMGRTKVQMWFDPTHTAAEKRRAAEVENARNGGADDADIAETFAVRRNVLEVWDRGATEADRETVEGCLSTD
jgi:hypothetical protein